MEEETEVELSIMAGGGADWIVKKKIRRGEGDMICRGAGGVIAGIDGGGQ